MKVLWILNKPLPEAMSFLTGNPEVSRSTGSWVCALGEALQGEADLRLFTASPSHLVTELSFMEGRLAGHFIFPARQNPWKEIFSRIQPDVIHIHGTEYPHALQFVQTCGSHSVVVSLQGMTSVIREHYLGGIPESQIRKYISLRDRIRKDSLIDQWRSVSLRGEAEIELLKSVGHVIGRTSWDRAVSLSINPDLHYHFCNEVLRAPFYSGKWEYGHCTHHRLFLSQGHYPLKGAHILMEALPDVLKQYPDTTVHIAGGNVLRGNTWTDKLLRSGYGRYLDALMRKNQVAETVHFTGDLDAEAFKKELLEAEIFVSASTIENSPNSLCEAQILGVPCIASDVGGTSDLIPDPACGTLFPSGNPSALASAICEDFTRSASFDNGSMRALALHRHDPEVIVRQMLEIYGEVAA